MLFAVRFHDFPGQTHLRTSHFKAHIDWLDRNRDRILIAGSLREADSEAPVGGLWIVSAESRLQVEALLQSDPFWVHGLRESVEIHSWHRAFPEAVTI